MAANGTTRMDTTCCIVGGGPAGIVLGFLLARAGIDVVVLEKHADFLRDFRGDTIHPSTLEILHELGLLNEFLALPHDEVRELSALIGDTPVKIVDCTHLPTVCKFIALMPQWDFLNFFAGKAKQFPAFHLLVKTRAVDLIYDDAGTGIRGVRAAGENGDVTIFADLTIGADGRHSIVREKARLPIMDLGAPMDVLWMRISRQPSDPPTTFVRFLQGRMLVQLNRRTYWQCAYVIAKGGYDEIKRAGIEAFRQELLELAPHLKERVNELKSFDDISLLTVAVDRLKQWHKPGLLCIGDCAHAMSPIGGVGINLAIQDAIATANLLTAPLLNGTISEQDLAKVQRRREFPTRATQRLQVVAQNRVIRRVLEKRNQPAANTSLPLLLKLMNAFPVLRRIPARIVGVGFRPEHIRTTPANSNVRS
jgi:2-polyprenyl-6-methoxyphenol hydroxylase-like FAD-dependent oxidoreductase